MHKLIVVISLFFCLIVSGCTKELPPGVYDTSDVGKLKKVVPGVIISKRAVKFHSKNMENSDPGAPGSEMVDGGRGYVYVIKLNAGGIVSIAQSEDLRLKVKQKVLVVYGKHSRILPDDGSED
jgi:outer membrane lipoprotein SlyB